MAIFLLIIVGIRVRACYFRYSARPASLLENDTAVQCQTAIHSSDKSRAITGNIAWQGPNAVSPGTPFSKMVDVMGMSHQGYAKVAAWHAAEAGKLLVMTECCSCQTQRGEDADLIADRDPSVAAWDSNEPSRCLSAKVQTSDVYVIGSNMIDRSYVCVCVWVPVLYSLLFNIYVCCISIPTVISTYVT